LTVQELLSSSERLGVTVPETTAFQRLTERVDEWKVKVHSALANDSIAQIHQLITAETLHRGKRNGSDRETCSKPVPTDMSDLLSSLQALPEFGKII